MDPLVSIGRIAAALGPFVDRVVFVGGAAAPLMISDVRAERIRPTDDVDVIAETVSYAEHAAFETTLEGLGFAHDTSEGAPICRWMYDGIVVDVMPTDPSALGFTNRWYAYAVETARWTTLPAGARIRTATPVAFVATKLDAFHSPTRRFARDVWASHDLEDLLTVIEGRPEMDAEIEDARLDVRNYICDSVRTLLSGPDFADVVEGHIEGGPGRADRARVLLARLRHIATFAQG